ncbi:hypothetical protein [Aurantiacibacter sp. D1-12]|uniref:hypothetical protein n=1 Tax=Aurantiacibacter sp. D1-12 TaxID=2993658 RepID=UPI00237CA4AD|nr:hypothetical protein [Aurantiacibacter sp. D1-12]MDE1466109.1 hypothetical protein [Aurantiacibacter sp. D1-12]
MRIYFTLLFAVSNCQLGDGGNVHGNDADWPEIREVRATWDVSFARDGFRDSLTVQDRYGNPVYEFECFSGGDADQLRWSNENGVMLIADLSCVLFEAGDEVRGDSLLSQVDDTRDYQSRGFFWVHQLTGQCASHEAYGANRSISVRGIEVHLSVGAIGPDRMATLEVEFTNQGENRSPFAAPPEYPGYPQYCRGTEE